ncbi:MAG: peptidoglycan-binding protein [Clostridia bacterium]|nr:peptidoglycan-binding protein [Clostridia bacterium]
MRKNISRVIAFIVAMVLSMAFIASALAYETIPYGEQSNAVRKMQSKLKSKGFYGGAVDGKFGPSTKAAVKKFQAYVGISADGKPGNKTLTALYEGKSALNKTSNTELKEVTKPSNPRTLYYGCTGARVRELQRALYKAGVYKGAIDGIYGDLTLAAVKKYQSKKGLHADGMAGTKTLASLRKSTGSNIAGFMLLDIGSKGSEVKSVSRRMVAWGYTTSITDTYDAALAAGVKAWQRDNGYTQTGAVTENQYNKMVIGD